MTDYRRAGVELEDDTMGDMFHALQLLHTDPQVAARHPDGDIAAIRFIRPDIVYTETIQIAEDASGARSIKLLSCWESGKELVASEPAHPLSETFTLQDFLDELVDTYRWRIRQDL